MIKVAIVGILMGAAEVVPGVSGGTIAFVSGFYQRLIDGIRRFTPTSLWSKRSQGIVGMWSQLDINFLLVLFGSMLLSVVMLARVVSYLLVEYPVPVWALFFGLVLASVFVVGRRLGVITLRMYINLLIGMALGIIVTRFVPIDAEVTPLILFGGGCIAICAWILPGMSGSFILLIFGLYQTIILAVGDLDVVTLSYFGAGCLVGIISFARVLSWLLNQYYNMTVSLLVGFMIGSLSKLWPWKHTTSYQIKPDGSQMPVVQEPVSPMNYEYLTGQEPMIALAVAGAVAGVVLIVVLDRFAFVSTAVSEKTALSEKQP